MNSWQASEPTPEQIAMTKKVETAVCNEINLLAREGIPLACLLTGMGMAIADLLTTQAGPESVAPWFAAKADLIRSLQAPH